MLLENKKWLIAVSGGPDSMALVKLCLDWNLNIGIAHVNYHHRNSANEEEEYVRSFARSHSIPCFVYNEYVTYCGNFEAQARKMRYEFFKEIVNKEHYDGVLVAHHKDDLLETYLMQKEKKLIPETYGLASTMYYEGMLVCRPLLDYTKKELEDICKKANIKYYIDCTNSDTTYARNFMRHSILKDMNEKNKENLLLEIKEKNEHIQKIRNTVKKFIVDKKININDYRNLNEEERLTLLHLFLKEYYRKDQGMSFSYKKEIDSILCKQNDCMIPLEEYVIVQDKDYFFVILKPHSYSYTIHNSLEKIECDYFKISDVGEKSESITLQEEDYPLTIRNAKDGDVIQMRFGKKKVHRFFIDRHIPLYKREMWPVVLNRNNEVILVPKLGPDVNHYSIKPDFYVIQY